MIESVTAVILNSYSKIELSSSYNDNDDYISMIIIEALLVRKLRIPKECDKMLNDGKFIK